MNAGLSATPIGRDEDAGDHRAQAFFRANLEGFRKHAPHLFQRLTSIEQPHSCLLVEPDGTVDMAFLGKRFYGEDAAAFAERQLAEYFTAPKRYTLAEPSNGDLEGYSGSYCNRLVAGMAERGIAYDLQQCPEESHFLVVFGIGLGLHLESLIKRTGAQVICLVEPNLECLYHSLFVADWARIFAWIEERELELSFVVARSSSAIASKVRSSLRADQPTFVDGIYVFTHYPSAILWQAWHRFRDEMYIVLAGLGFLEDELIMTRNAIANMAGGDLRVLAGSHPPKPEPVFIVGSGPSLEKDLDFIAAHADQAVIFSVGTGLRVLLKHGVRPDFHIELENGILNAELLEATAEGFELSGISLVASVSARPRAIACFDDVAVFFRENVSSTKVFAGDLPILQPAGPTVSNTGLKAGLRMGFRTFYLFGVDMGSREKDKFHAEGSAYSLSRFTDQTVAQSMFPANFGGDAIGEKVFNWSRASLESVICSQPEITVYNCSDGARIQGAIPMVARAVSLSGEPVDKLRIKREIRAHLNVTTVERARAKWDADQRVAELSAFFDRIDDTLERACKASEADSSWMVDVGRHVRDTALTSPIIVSYVGGTLGVLVGVARWYARRVVDPQRALEFQHFAAEGIRELSATFRRELSTLYREVETLLGAEGSDRLA